MKKAIVLNFKTNNLGDDIQTYAAMQLLPDFDIILDRENLSSPNIVEPVKFICNGWFMDKPQNWPPAPNLIPLFISFHVSDFNNSNKLMLSDRLLEYYKKHEPIGCRDYYTLGLFQSIGINAYFSGCLTLTLKNKFSNYERNSEILVVDPFLFYLNNNFKVSIIENLIPKSFHDNIRYITHHKKPNEDIKKRLNEISDLLERYSKAHLVITSRIHAALPAMALGTPVLFIDVGYDNIPQRTRFGGLIDLMQTIGKETIKFTDSSYLSRIYRKLNIFEVVSPIKKFNFNWDDPPKPPRLIKEFDVKLRNTTNDFFFSHY